MSTTIIRNGEKVDISGEEELRYYVDDLGMNEAGARELIGIGNGTIPGDVLTTEQLRELAPDEASD